MSENISVQAGYDAFFRSGCSHWAARTKIYYDTNIKYFLQYLEDDFQKSVSEIELQELPSDVLNSYVIWLRNKSKFSDHPLRAQMNVNGTIKSNTVNTYMRAVKCFFNFLYQNHYTRIRYTENVKLPRSDDDQIVPLLNSEVYRIDHLFDLSVDNDLRNMCILHLMLDAGLRSSEVINLEPGDLIYDSNTIVINRSKGDKSRVVIMAPPLKSLLQEYVMRFHPSGTLFRKTTENKAINESVIKALFRRVKRLTGIDRLHPHLLRHTFATSYIMGGGNLETLRILMGHFDYSVTRRYLHLAAQHRITGADIYRLDPVFFKSSY